MLKNAIMGLFVGITLIFMISIGYADTAYSVTLTVQNISIPALAAVKYSPAVQSYYEGVAEQFSIYYYTTYPTIYITGASAQPISPDFFDTGTSYLSLGYSKTFAYTCVTTSCTLILNMTTNPCNPPYFNQVGQFFGSGTSSYCLHIYDQYGCGGSNNNQACDFDYVVTPTVGNKVQWNFGTI